MQLADSIDDRTDEILAEWETFAATRLPAGAKLDARALRDHAPQILRAVAADLRTPQTPAEQLAKSHGLAPLVPCVPETAAEAHGTLRAQSGFSIVQVVSEYRALRASVLRLWKEANAACECAGVTDEIMRFNEAIDQAIAESVSLYSQELDRSRHLFLGILGHELRSPLNAIQMTAKYLEQIRSNEVISKAAQRLINSGSRMQALLDDLLDYSRATLKGVWDAKRLYQALCNLVINALAHGAFSEPVRVRVAGSALQVAVSVINQGVAIHPSKLHALFDPLRRGSAELEPTSTHLGLGLFIAREIVKAHGGTIDVTSKDRETVFAIHLPRLSPTLGDSQVPASHVE